MKIVILRFKMYFDMNENIVPGLKKLIISFVVLALLAACKRTDQSTKNDENSAGITGQSAVIADTITDCHYTFDQAIHGTTAPASIIKQLTLLDVVYYSTDGKLHKGQILTNKKMADDIDAVFKYMLTMKFPVYQAIPVVKYDWDDEASMEANNTYSFCYRDISYSRHAQGMAIDINPFFNPVRWKGDSVHGRTVEPKGAQYRPDVPGTFYKDHPVVKEFKKLGFRWGHTFSKKYDDHHFEKK